MLSRISSTCGLRVYRSRLVRVRALDGGYAQELPAHYAVDHHAESPADVLLSVYKQDGYVEGVEEADESRPSAQVGREGENPADDGDD
uniref:Uncharacterized protein n=1 Tax=Steinernema glaseri TaxID=37863 RepID=A0A1I7ZWG8_9BILA